MTSDLLALHAFHHLALITIMIFTGKTTWHITPNLDITPGEPANLHQGQNLLINAATRVWDLMYVSKKPALEEVFKTSFGQQNSTPPLESIRANVYESASKIWFSYIEQEKKGSFAKVPPWEFHSQLQVIFFCKNHMKNMTIGTCIYLNTGSYKYLQKLATPDSA